MLRNRWFQLSLIALALFGLAVFVLARPATTALASLSQATAQSPAAPNAPTGAYYWSYAAKFVCGYQSPAPVAGAIVGEPVVKPGNYATDINIQNPNFKIVPLIKRVIVLVEGDTVHREPEFAGPTGSDALELPADFATMDDCNKLWTLTHLAAPTTPMPLFIGYLVILSPLDLNVNVVYTSNAPGVAGNQPTSNSIDVLTVTGKRVFLPPGTNP